MVYKATDDETKCDQKMLKQFSFQATKIDSEAINNYVSGGIDIKTVYRLLILRLLIEELIRQFLCKGSD